MLFQQPTTFETTIILQRKRGIGTKPKEESKNIT